MEKIFNCTFHVYIYTNDHEGEIHVRRDLSKSLHVPSILFNQFFQSNRNLRIITVAYKAINDDNNDDEYEHIYDELLLLTKHYL